VPPRGQKEVWYQRCLRSKAKHTEEEKYIKIQQPAINKLPYVNNSFFKKLFKFLTPEDVIEVFTHMLLEKSVLIVSDDIENLIPIIDALQNLIYPFQYTTCIPILLSNSDDIDVSNINIVTSPVTYLIGIIERDYPIAQQILQEEDKINPFIVNLCQKQIGLLKNLTASEIELKKKKSKAAKASIYSLPQTLYNDLLCKIKRAIMLNEVKKGEPAWSYSDTTIYNIRKAFYDVLVHLFAYYKDLVKEEQDEIVFDIKKFQQISKKYRDFYKVFFNNQTNRVDHQMFMNFITSSRIASMENTNFTIRLFNAWIDQILSEDSIAPHRVEIPFLTDKSNDIKERYQPDPVYQMNCSPQKVAEAYLKNPHQPPLLPIKFSRNKDNSLKINYLIFPSLNKSIYENIHCLYELDVAPNFLLEITSQTRSESNMQYKSIFEKKKITIPQVIRTEGTYVYLSWIYMWCATLPLQDPLEKKFRFQQLLKVLNKLKSEYFHRPVLDLFFLLIETSYRHGTFKMTQKIFDTLKRYDLQADARITYRYQQHMSKESMVVTAIKEKQKKMNKNNNYNS